MNGYTLTLKDAIKPPLPTDGSVFRPDVLCNLSAAEVALQSIRIGREAAALGDLFEIQSGQEGRLMLDLGGDALRFDRLGSGMKSGHLTVVGSAGDDLGASMSGGLVEVHGDAGQRVGGPATTSDRGMTGGHIIVQGDVGDYAGLRMRRGTISVRGKAGRSPGYRMLAGTLAVCEGPYNQPGLEMRRGTIMLLDRNAAPPAEPSFVAESEFAVDELPILSLLIQAIMLPGYFVAMNQVPKRFRLYTGDRFELNKGEIWQWLS